MSLSVTKENCAEFFINIENSLKELTIDQLRYLYLFKEETKSIIISFDKDYNPFMGYTRGFNQPNKRKYLKKPIPLFYNKLELNLKSFKNFFDVQGGRVFIRSDSCYNKDAGKEIQIITLITWPLNIDPYKKALDIYNDILKRKNYEKKFPRCIDEYVKDDYFPHNALGESTIIDDKVGEIIDLVGEEGKLVIKFKIQGGEVKNYHSDVLRNYSLKRKK